MKCKVAHLSSHHNILDNRIFYRECRSLVAAGYDVILVAQHETDEVREDVRILGVPHHKNRLQRVLVTTFRVVRRAWKERPEIFHFHDPELIPWGIVLRLLGKKVIYDVHEDFSQAAEVRSWVPGWGRAALSCAIRLTNRMVPHLFSIIIAERYYARSFPHATKVLNYTHLDDYAKVIDIRRNPTALNRVRLLYTGSITEGRGARQHLGLLQHLPGTAELRLVGQCSIPALREKMKAVAVERPQLQLEISERWIAYQQIVETYEEEWTAGLALFPDTSHYREKELTKFFEYMAAGLPIVCSDFPTWRAMVAEQGVGICVNPEDSAAAAAAVLWIASHPEEALAMGERGRRLVRERFNWSSEARNLIDLYERLLSPETWDRKEFPTGNATRS